MNQAQQHRLRGTQAQTQKKCHGEQQGQRAQQREQRVTQTRGPEGGRQHLPFVQVAVDPGHGEAHHKGGYAKTAHDQPDLGRREFDQRAIDGHHEREHVPAHIEERAGDEDGAQGLVAQQVHHVRIRRAFGHLTRGHRGLFAQQQGQESQRRKHRQNQKCPGVAHEVNGVPDDHRPQHRGHRKSHRQPGVGLGSRGGRAGVAHGIADANVEQHEAGTQHDACRTQCRDGMVQERQQAGHGHAAG